jgi:hypothetical protein
MGDMARFFFEFRVVDPARGAYACLIRTIVERGLGNDVLLSTLNYELLLEQAINQCGHVVDYGSPPSPGRLSVVKLHGSCNFLPNARGVGSGLAMRPGMVFETGFRIAGLSEVMRYSSVEPSLYPVMCLYMPGKVTHMSPHSMSRVQACWAEQVRAAEKMFLVGLRPNDGDKHLWDAVAESKAKVFCVGNKREYDAWCDRRRKGKPTFLGSRFEEAHEGIAGNL